jgi:hypothetical protein
MRNRILSLASLFVTALAALPAAVPGVELDLQGTLSVSPDPLAAGDQATIKLSNPAMAGQTVTITIKSGSPANPEPQTITIVLDDTGVGSAEWTVPGWSSAIFSAPGAADVRKSIS